MGINDTDALPTTRCSTYHKMLYLPQDALPTTRCSTYHKTFTDSLDTVYYRRQVTSIKVFDSDVSYVVDMEVGLDGHKMRAVNF